MGGGGGAGWWGFFFFFFFFFFFLRSFGYLYAQETLKLSNISEGRKMAESKSESVATIIS